MGDKKRNIGIDVFRVISAITVCMFHTTGHLGCYYGILQNYSRMGGFYDRLLHVIRFFAIYHL